MVALSDPTERLMKAEDHAGSCPIEAFEELAADIPTAHAGASAFKGVGHFFGCHPVTMTTLRWAL
jgi:hypothetical protein